MKVAYKNVKTGAMTEVTADYCVSCLPLTILSTLDVNLSPETMAAVKATPYSPSAKMGLQMKRRFWEEDDRIFGGHLYSNLPFGNFSYPSWGYFGDKGVLLGFYGNGQMAGVVNMPIKDRIEHVLIARQQSASADPRGVRDGLLHVLGEDAVQPRRVRRRRRWRQRERLAALGKPDSRIYLGCAAVSGNGGWQEGAVAAAWKQVKALHETRDDQHCRQRDEP